MQQQPQRDQVGQAVLTQLRDAAQLTTIAGVLAVLQSLDTVLPVTDGLKWFNLLYLLVTRAVHETPPAQGWATPRWLTQLDITFAQLYFAALEGSYATPATVPRAWAALFEVRSVPDIQRVQFALAGMNAHINHDLPLALVQTGKALGITPERGTAQYRDFEAVNGIIDAVEPETLQYLATGLVGLVEQDLNVVGRVVSNWNVVVARDTAWTNAELLWRVRDLPNASDQLLLALDRLTGFAGRGLLLPV